MALIDCPECGRSVSDKAAACPDCAHPIAGASGPPQPAGGREEPSIEKNYLKEKQVTITSSRATVGSKTYMVANISSLKKLRNSWPRGGLGFFALLCGIGAYGLESTFVGVLGVLLVLVAIFGKHQYVLVITGSGGEQRALVTRDKNFFERVVAALEQAIVDRG